jgi:hypothetical protein
MKLRFLWTLLLAVPVFAQTAKVIQLSPEDAKEAKLLYDLKKDLVKQQDEFDEKIRKAYLTTTYKATKNSVCYWSLYGSVYYTSSVSENGICTGIKEGWYNGFNYSEDFLFIVPNPPPTTSYTVGDHGYALTTNPSPTTWTFNGATN